MFSVFAIYGNNWTKFGHLEKDHDSTKWDEYI